MELTEEQKAYVAELAAGKAENEVAEGKGDTSVFHGKAEADYQGTAGWGGWRGYCAGYCGGWWCCCCLGREGGVVSRGQSGTGGC